MTLKLGIVGFGKIARDEHVTAIAALGGAELVAVASRNGRAEGLPGYDTQAEMLAAHPELDAVVLCQPPGPRFAAAREALLAAKHVFLEKPPGATVREVELLRTLAQERGLSLFASWHSRWSEPVAELRRWCAGRRLRRIAIDWKEDVRLWHPGQAWIWEPGGFGVMDPGINALSILTEVLPVPVRLVESRLAFPANRATPIAADLALETASGTPVAVAFDWRQTGPQIWRIVVEAQDDRYVFEQGGEDAAHVGEGSLSAIALEYRAMYRHFAKLVEEGRSDVDTAPIQIVADAFLRGKIDFVERFED